MNIFEQLLEDYAVDADILPSALQEKILAGVVYWTDLDFQDLELDIEFANDDRINKTASMQSLLTNLSQLVMGDCLTGLYNRRYFDRAFYSEIERSVREHRSLALAIIDIDYFKKINDTWGHDGGDEVLKAVAGIMRKNIRQSDTLVRIGGEEFAVMMPNIRHEIAKDVMERLRHDIEKSVISIGTNELNTSVSIGIAVREPTDQFLSADAFYKQADQALYQAKETGRNKVVLYSLPTSTELSSSEREALML